MNLEVMILRKSFVLSDSDEMVSGLFIIVGIVASLLLRIWLKISRTSGIQDIFVQLWTRLLDRSCILRFLERPLWNVLKVERVLLFHVIDMLIVVTASYHRSKFRSEQKLSVR